MLSKKTILIVEDEDAILLALQRILELTGSYEVFTALDGQIALDKLHGMVPDLIISDVSMPNLNGIELCTEVRRNPVTKSTPFIFLTGKKEKLIECINAGGDDFLMKPFNVEEVLVKIEAIFRRIDQSKEQASQHKGLIEDLAVEKILELCLKEQISGDLLLQQAGEIGVLKLKNGDIKSIDYRNLSDDAALDALMLWRKGTFVIRPLAISIKADSSTLVEKIDLDAGREIGSYCWWVGTIDPEKSRQVNAYMRIFIKNDKQVVSMIDPGSPLYFKEISSKMSGILEKGQNVNLYFLMDADADVCLNAGFLRKVNPRAICLTSVQNWEFVKHYEIDLKNVKKVNLQKNEEIKLSTGNSLRFIPIPFCKSVSSFMIYDVENRILFSGALFSSDSTNESNRNNFFAEESDWQDIADFQTINISSNAALINALNQLAYLKPPPQLVAPRYGKLIRHDILQIFIERLRNLSVGINAGHSQNTARNFESEKVISIN